MDEVIARIKTYVLVIDSTITDNDFLEYMINEVVDRALVYMNRVQLVLQYEEDIVDYPIDDKTDTSETWYEYWKSYTAYPIPPRLERTIANTVVGAYKTVIERNSADTGFASKVKDHEQEVSYTNEIASYLSSSGDTEIFAGTTKLMNGYRLPTIITEY